MKRILCFCISICMFMISIHGESYCVMLDDDNTVVEEKDMNAPQSVASISKVMTAIIAIEQGDLADTWTCGAELKEAYGSSIYLKEGQEVSLKSLLYGLMLRSGNDAALEIAMHICKDEQSFVELMNAKAKQIGMNSTIFHNASGLDEDDSGNISTAYDMAVLMSYAMKNSTFKEITSTKYYTSEWNYRWQNKNRLLFDFPFTNGGKTGFTKKAGRTLVTTATNHGVESVVVTLQMSDDFNFHKEKHIEALEQYQSIEVLAQGEYVAANRKIVVKEPIKVSVKNDGSDNVQVTSHFENKKYVVEVMKNENLNVYEFEVSTLSKHKKGWLS